MALTLLLLTVSMLAANPPVGDGVIEGTVVRAIDQAPVPGAEVVLRAKIGGQLLAVAETTADAQGRFRFEHLPVDGNCVYLPGANRDGIHYPGPSVRLSSLLHRAERETGGARRRHVSLIRWWCGGMRSFFALRRRPSSHGVDAGRQPQPGMLRGQIRW